MPRRIEVNPELLTTAGGQVTGYTQDLEATFTSGDARMSAAQSGWTGRSAQALNTRVAAWQTTSAVISGRLVDHSAAFRITGAEFAETEQNNASAVARVDGQSRV